MDIAEIIEELLGLLKTRQVSIRKASMGGDGGGLCMVRGQYLFFVDSQEQSAETAAKAAAAVRKLVDVEGIFIKPEVREYIDSKLEQ